MYNFQKISVTTILVVILNKLKKKFIRMQKKFIKFKLKLKTKEEESVHNYVLNLTKDIKGRCNDPAATNVFKSDENFAILKNVKRIANKQQMKCSSTQIEPYVGFTQFLKKWMLTQFLKKWMLKTKERRNMNY